MIDSEWKIIYRDCLHHQPHNPGIDDAPIIDKYGDQCWYNEGKRHRDGDLPAIIRSSGLQYWYKNGICHRDGDKPVIICPSGSHHWYKNGLIYF